MKKYAVTFLLCATFMISEIHTFWSGNNIVQNWIWYRPTPMLVQWNVKFAMDQLVWMVIALTIILYGKTRSQNKINHTSVIVFLLWCVFDTFSYFYNYKTFGYFATYFWIIGWWVIIYYWDSKYTRWLFRQLQ
jgi:hypothetical protein